MQANDDGELTAIESLAQAPSVLQTWPVLLAKAAYARVARVGATPAVEAVTPDTTSSDETEGAPVPKASRTRRRKVNGRK